MTELSSSSSLSTNTTKFTRGKRLAAPQRCLLLRSLDLLRMRMVVVDSKYAARTVRLLIRPLKLEDAEDVVLMRKDAEVMKHTYVAYGHSCVLYSCF